jgi:hypothetical protein
MYFSGVTNRWRDGGILGFPLCHPSMAYPSGAIGGEGASQSVPKRFRRIETHLPASPYASR